MMLERGDQRTERMAVGDRDSNLVLMFKRATYDGLALTDVSEAGRKKKIKKNQRENSRRRTSRRRS